MILAYLIALTQVSRGQQGSGVKKSLPLPLPSHTLNPDPQGLPLPLLNTNFMLCIGQDGGEPMGVQESTLTLTLENPHP